MEKGCVQVYTGNGKGKTTAAFGIALRAIGAGYRVYIGQFMKKGEYSEIKAFKYFDSDKITLEQFGHGEELTHKDEQAYSEAANNGLKRALEVLRSNDYDMVILDELNVAVYFGYVKLDDALNLLNEKSDNTELIITGRYAKDEIIQKADLVTEMKEIKHYYTKGINARIGIEK